MASYYCPKCDENRSETPFCSKHGAMRCQDSERLQEALRVLHELFEVGDLDDHFYAIREREGEGWDGPLMIRWGEATAKARELLKNYKP